MTATITNTTPTPGRVGSQSRPRWPRLLAITVAVQPVLIAVNATFHPEVDFNGEGLLAGAAEGPGSWYAVHMIAAIGALLGVPAALGLRRLVRDRGRVLADIAVGAALVAAALLSLSFSAEASVMRLAASAEVDHHAAVTMADAYADSPEFYAVGIGVFAAMVAGLLFSVALLREGHVPCWMPWTSLVGTLATAVAAPGTPLAPISFGIVAVAAIGLSRYVADAP